MMKKTAIVLFNLGGPSDLDSVQGFLFNLFYDRAIINLPNPLRWLIAKIISWRRTPTAKEIYELMGGKSPILENTINQANELEQALNNKIGNLKEIKIFVSMRYHHPFSEEVIKNIDLYKPDEIILLPLYPQFSTTTTQSSIKDFKEKYSGKSKIKALCCYPKSRGIVDYFTAKIQAHLIDDHNDIMILFSAHGLPKNIIDNGDPYQWQVEQTVNEIISKLSLQKNCWKICYQSRVGPVEWIKPYTDEEIISASKQNKLIILVPITFVSEHSETLVELDIEYKKLAEENGCKKYIRIPTPSVDPLFIEDLANLCLGLINQNTSDNYYITSNEQKRICSDKFCCCPIQTKGN